MTPRPFKLTMKNNFTYIFFLLILWMACSSDYDKRQTSNDIITKPKVKTKISMFCDSVEHRREEFDENGHKIFLSSVAGTNTTRWIYENDKLIKLIDSNKQSKTSVITTYFYNDIGQMVSAIHDDTARQRKSWIAYEYYDKNLIKETYFDHDSLVSFWIDYEYDAQNRKIKQNHTVYSLKGEIRVPITQTYLYQYNLDGEILHFSHIFNNRPDTTNYKYTFNENGLPKSLGVMVNDFLQECSELYRYEYYETKGN